MKLKLFRLVFWMWFRSNGYYLWSKFWRALLERDYRKQKLTEYADLKQLEVALGKMKWTQDPMNGMFDVISSPRKVEAILQDKLTGKSEVANVGDCDEFAQYAADRIQDMIARKKTSLQNPYFVTINWFGKGGEFHGHNICVFYDPDKKKWGQIGNWWGGKAHIMYDGVDDVADWYARRNPRDGEGKLIAYCAATPDLKKRIVLSTS